jgi:hypothetical protein
MLRFYADRHYEQLKQIDPHCLENIVAFASTFGCGTEDISVATRYQVESYCIALALECMTQLVPFEEDHNV